MATRIDLTFDAAHPTTLAEFWKTALGYVDEPPPAPFATREEWVASYPDDPEDDSDDAAWLCDPDGVGPRVCILQVREPKVAKNRLHMDLRVSTGQPDRWAAVEAEARRLEAAGAVVVRDYARHHIVMRDPEGNEFCVA